MAVASCLVDTSVLLRIARRSDAQHAVADSAITRLASQGAELHYTHQNVAEMWNVMTRPSEHNGFGFSRSEADKQVAAVESGMSLLVDSAAVYQEWRRLVVQHNIKGVQVHDARLAAAMYVHGIVDILTLNARDFGRFTGLNVLHPASV
jgi:predicted nucleic acid-binding protein